MYDLIIIGAGPAGLSAAIYAARYNLKTMVISPNVGGVANEAHKVENYPGYKSISGMELMSKFKEQVDNFHVPIKYGTVNKIESGFKVYCCDETYECKTIILATGLTRRHLGCKGEAEFNGRGVSYCALCDAAFFKDKKVVVVGGANSAIQGALLLCEWASKVYVVYRKDKLRADPIWVDKLKDCDKVEYVFNANITEIKGDKFVTSVDLNTGNSLEVGGVFIEIGFEAKNEFVKELGVEIDDWSFIKVDNEMRTNIPKVYAAGDITSNFKEWKQIISAAAEGGMAATSAYNDLKE